MHAHSMNPSGMPGKATHGVIPDRIARMPPRTWSRLRMLCVGLVASVPEALSVVVVFVLSFMVLDSMLSLAFLCWPVLSPNYFHVVDRRVWQLNWSPLAKAANSAGVVGALALELYAVAFVVAVGVVGIKVWSARRVILPLASEGR